MNSLSSSSLDVDVALISRKSKVVVTRDLGPDVLGKLREDRSVDVRRPHLPSGWRWSDTTGV